jgi:regulator of protease activity HflC (stomatin/prohibitin superfamily)
MSDTRSGPESPLDVLARLWDGLARWYRRSYTTIVIVALVLAVAVVYFLPRVLVEIPPGHGGVLWRRFEGGTVFGPALGEGYQLIWPWDNVYNYDLRLRQFSETLETLSADGLTISIEVSIRYRLAPDDLGYLHASVGPDFENKIIKPQVAYAVQSLAAMYPSEALMGSFRAVLQSNIFQTLTDRLRINEIGALNPATGVSALAAPPPSPAGDQERGSARRHGYVNTAVNALNTPMILLQDLLISRVVLPDRVRGAIEAKLEQVQRAEEYQYRLESERYESERKALEAEGIRRFQDTVSKGITPSYLSWRGIEATLALAQSPNAKIIVIGGSNGLPLILNTGDGAGLGANAQPPTGNAAPAGAATSGALAEPPTGVTSPSAAGAALLSAIGKSLTSTIAPAVDGAPPAQPAPAPPATGTPAARTGATTGHAAPQPSPAQPADGQPAKRTR